MTIFAFIYIVLIFPPLHSLDAVVATNRMPLTTTVATDTGKKSNVNILYAKVLTYIYFIAPLSALSPLLHTDYFYFEFKFYLYCTC